MNIVKPRPSREQQNPTLFSLALQHPLFPSPSPPPYSLTCMATGKSACASGGKKTSTAFFWKG